MGIDGCIDWSIVIIPQYVQRSEQHILWFKCIQFYLSIILWYNWENVISEQSTVINISFQSNKEKINSEEIDKNTIHLDLRPQSLSTVISEVMLTNHLLLMWNIQVFGEKCHFRNYASTTHWLWIIQRMCGVILFITHFLPTSVFH